ncbi:hypothetical protein GF373_04795, partial [bacterium]|nr:hypothetical protein [bacterium]
MKGFRVFWVVVVCLSFCLGAVGQDITSDLEAYWTFDEYDGGDAADVSGNDRHAFVENGQPLPSAGKKGNGVYFDGSSGFLTDWPGIQGSEPRTISCWVKSTDLGNGLVGWGDTGTGTKWHFRINDSSSQPDESVLGAPRTEYQGSQTIAEGTVDDNEWHHVVSVFEGLYPTDVTHYIDGVLSPTKWIGDETLEINTVTSSEDANVTVGSRVQGGSFDRITGWMDEVRIYSRALSADDVMALYDEAKAPQSVAMRSFSQGFAAQSKPVEVTLNIALPKAGTLTEEIPDGWSASDISDGGTADGNTITWEVTEAVSSVSYMATPGAGATDNVFSGSLDGLITGGNPMVTILEEGVGDFDFQADIGGVAAEGSASFNNGEYSVIGSGADIWGSADGFHFLFNEVTGPFTMKGNAIIFAFDFGGHDWMKGGLMIRNNLTAGSSYGFNMVRTDLQLSSQARTAQGNGAITVQDLTDDQLGDMEIQRVGNLIKFYRIDGAGEKQPHGEVVLSDLEDPVYAGLSTTSHSNGDLAEMLFQNFEMELLPYSASRSITQLSEGRMGFGDSAEVKVAIYVRNQEESTVIETPPEGWEISDLQPSAGEAVVNGDGAIEWTIGDFEGEAELTYTVTTPETPDNAVLVGTFSGALNNEEDIVGDAELMAVGFVAKEVIDQQEYESGLEAYWTFDEWDGSVAEESTANGYDATISEGQPVSSDDAIMGKALEFDGDSNLTVPWTGVQGNT